MSKCYHIVLHGYNPNEIEYTWKEDYSTQWGPKTKIKSVKYRPLIGMYSKTCCKETMEDALQAARDLWSERFVGKMKQVRIFPNGWTLSEINAAIDQYESSNGSKIKIWVSGHPILFEANNFDKFKRDKDVPF